MATTQIKRGEGDTSGVTLPLFTFDSIFDTDFGLMFLINRQYLDTSVFNEEFFKKNDTMKKMVLTLYRREDKNPLKMALLHPEEADEWYQEFMDKKYNDILEYSMANSIYSLLNTFISMGGMKPGIVYRRIEEKAIIENDPILTHLPKYTLEDMLKEPSLCNLYEQFFFKHIGDEYTHIIKNVTVKTIYMQNYRFNKEEGSQNPEHPFRKCNELEIFALQRCRLYSIDAYNTESLVNITGEQQS